jgi:DNA polymerase
MASRPASRAAAQTKAQAAAQPKTLAQLNRLIAASAAPFKGGEHAVLGEGPLRAPLAFVGEQPGDQEDIQGHPFVGPAGLVLRRMMAEAGIAPERAYLSNAVKHFKFTQRGKKRLHQRPTAGEIEHYRWWLGLELEFVDPRLVVALGASAVRALAGRTLPIGANRGETMFGERRGFITVHPSSLLRIPDQAARRQARAAFLADLKQIKALAQKPGPPRRRA